MKLKGLRAMLVDAKTDHNQEMKEIFSHYNIPLTIATSAKQALEQALMSINTKAQYMQLRLRLKQSRRIIK